MSEKAGLISIEQWQQFEKALLFYSHAQDWDKVAKVNTKLVEVLTKAGKPSSPSQLAARQSLAATHKQVLQQLILAKEQLGQEMNQFKQQQDGLSAYQLTSVSGGAYD
ncbi:MULTISPECIES: hypothetical protein [unclassified Shewanella]|uniref:hypothetical protein n=1 Tax=unclassified Shewanella TaxID=196818 RepID=UPI001BBB8322|nr:MULTISPECIES: hypothetical protein [unclassified Shewanella]GIU14691.1 hypothetical protein TUM4444_24770 [Shewanella sp. MBTL60-112-B1]GIU37773.1 hypothetical protein TUM4445_30780 [Shewanella sp. MBTL60-112-B2]